MRQKREHDWQKDYSKLAYCSSHVRHLLAKHSVLYSLAVVLEEADTYRSSLPQSRVRRLFWSS